MGLLKALEEKYPVIDAAFQEFCGSLGIFTVEDILLHDLSAVVSFAKKQVNSENLKQGIDQVLSIVDGLHRPWLNGVELLRDTHQNKQTLFLGYEGVDSILPGALREGFVTELVGPSSSGKTQVCLQAAASIAKGYDGGVVFIDTGNSFSAARIAHLINQASYSALPQHNHDAAMKNISCYPVFDIFSLFDVLNQLESKLKSQMQARQCLVRLLIVDSFSSLIIPILGGGGPHGHALMISAGVLLKKIAHEYNVCVLVTNHMVAGEGGLGKPALGESWKSVPHMRLLLSRDLETDLCSISVIKHPLIATGNQARFKIYGR